MRYVTEETRHKLLYTVYEGTLLAARSREDSVQLGADCEAATRQMGDYAQTPEDICRIFTCDSSVVVTFPLWWQARV